MAYQLGLDLYESATQQFLLKVRNLLRALVTVQQPMEMGDEVKVEEGLAATTTVATVDDKSNVSDQVKPLVETLLNILNGEITINSNMQFLIKNKHSDLLILKTIKDAVRNSICHTATVIYNSFMHCGTTSDQFLR
jgi:26S proteasome regulatory subunit N2